MNTKHTPGPWRVSEVMIEGRKHLTYYVQTPGSASFQRLASTQNEANAKLIAAAPDLLAALDGLLKATRKAAAVAETANDEYADTDAHFVGEWIDQAREAIAKATT